MPKVKRGGAAVKRRPAAVKRRPAAAGPLQQRPAAAGSVSLSTASSSVPDVDGAAGPAGAGLGEPPAGEAAASVGAQVLSRRSFLSPFCFSSCD